MSAKSFENDPHSVQQVMRLLPHRYPFLLIDRILGYEVGCSLTALKNISINEPFFQGHFPGHPVMPGVLILEAMAQASGLLGFLTLGPDQAQQTSYVLASVNRYRIRRPMVPGDQLHIGTQLVQRKQGVWKFTCDTHVADERTAEAEIVVAQEKLGWGSHAGE